MFWFFFSSRQQTVHSSLTSNNSIHGCVVVTNCIFLLPRQPPFLSPSGSALSVFTQSQSLFFCSISFPSSWYLYSSVSSDCSFSLQRSLYPIPFLPHCRLSLSLNPNISIPVLFSRCLCATTRVSSPPRSLSCCISSPFFFSRCLSPFVSADRSVSLRAALWHGETELVCSCSDGGTWQSG